MTPALPPSGALVRFSRLPRASWAKTGEAYRVTYRPHIRAGKTGVHPTTSVQLWSEDHGCGTYDLAQAYDIAQWEVVP